MELKESRKLVASMMAMYPNYKPIDAEFTAQTWTEVLSDYSYQQVSVALKSYVRSDTSGFAPTPGQIIKTIQTITNPQTLTETEAWLLVSKALRNGYYGAEREFAALPPLVQKAVGSPSQLRNWSQTDLDSIENVVQSNFMRTYRIEVKRADEISRMSDDVQKHIAGVNEDRVHQLSNSTTPQIEMQKIEDPEEKTEPPSGMSEETRKRLDEMYEKFGGRK